MVHKLRNMKVKKVTVILAEEIIETTLTYNDINLKDVAHKLIEIAQPELEIAVSETQIEKFRQDAKRDYISSDVQFVGHEAYVDLYVRLKIDSYIRLEHAKHAYNEMVLAYSKQIETLK